MPTQAGSIVVNLSAGNAQFIADIETAKAKLHQFGEAGVSEHKAIAASAHLLEGNIFNNTRAMDGFLEKLKLGGLAQAAFPVIGAVAFAGVLVETGKKVYEFFKGLSEAGEKSKLAWNDLNGSLRLTNAQLDLANATLQQQINKLEGKRQNGLAIALEEARVAALGLGKQLETDLDSMEKLLKEQEAGYAAQLFGAFGDSDLTRKFREAHVTMQGVDDDEDKALTKAGPNATPAIVKAITDGFNAQRASVTEGLRQDIVDRLKDVSPDRVPNSDERDELTKLRGLLYSVEALSSHITKAALNQDLTVKKTGLEADKSNQPSTIFSDQMKRLTDETGKLKAQYASVGQPEFLRDMVTAAANATQQIDELNKSLAEAHKGNKALPGRADAGQIAAITRQELNNQKIKSEGEYNAKVKETDDSIQDRIESQQRLNDAIGKGYEAVRAATVINARSQFTKGHDNDTEWLLKHQSDIMKVGDQGGAAFDEGNQRTSEQAQKSLAEQIDLEQRVAAATLIGSGAVREAEHAYRLEKIALDDKTNATQKAIDVDLENQRYALDTLKIHNDLVKALGDEARANENLAGAAGKGAEAERLAKLQTGYDKMRSNGVPEADIQAKQLQDQKDYTTDLLVEAGKVGSKYDDQIEALEKQKELLLALIGLHTNIAGNSVAYRDSSIQSLKDQIARGDSQGLDTTSQKLQLGGLQAQQTLQGWNQNGAGDVVADVQKALTALPQELGNTLASAVFDHKKGDSAGKQFGQLFKGLGKSLFGDIAGQLIEKLAAEIAVHLLGIQIQATSLTATAALTAATTAAAAATTANTAAQLASGTASAAGGAAGGIGGAVVGVAGSAASAATGGMLGPIIGGVISGVISAAATIFGDFKIVKAINATTSAVNALGGRLGGTPTTTTSTGLTTSTTAPTTSTGIPVIGGFLQALFGFGGGSAPQPIPVTIVGISPLAPLSGLFKLFGFASGGRPTPGSPAWIGEKGPELWIPDGPGTVIPNHQTAAYMKYASATSMRGGSTSSNTYNGGSHVFHIHGVNDPQEMSRQIAKFLKTSSPVYSPFSR